MKILVKRVYETPQSGDGTRILVDRLWPRGLSKDKAKVDHWAKDIAPSTELRKWFHSDAGTWKEFKERYVRELESVPEAVEALRKEIGSKKATFLFGSRELEHNHAHLLKTYLGAD